MDLKYNCLVTPKTIIPLQIKPTITPNKYLASANSKSIIKLPGDVESEEIFIRLTNI